MENKKDLTTILKIDDNEKLVNFFVDNILYDSNQIIVFYVKFDHNNNGDYLFNSKIQYNDVNIVKYDKNKIILKRKIHKILREYKIKFNNVYYTDENGLILPENILKLYVTYNSIDIIESYKEFLTTQTFRLMSNYFIPDNIENELYKIIMQTKNYKTHLYFEGKINIIDKKSEIYLLNKIFENMKFYNCLSYIKNSEGNYIFIFKYDYKHLDEYDNDSLINYCREITKELKQYKHANYITLVNEKYEDLNITNFIFE